MPRPIGLQKSADDTTPAKWSPTKRFPSQEAYYPGTDELKPDEMRVICCGSGMPMPRTKQAAASFLIELSNGEKLIFDLGDDVPFPPPSVTARQQAAPGGEKYKTPEWIMQGFEWEALDLMDQIHEEFNEEFGTEFKFPLRPNDDKDK